MSDKKMVRSTSVSGYEGRVQKLWLEHIKKWTLWKNYFGDILVPTEEVVEMRSRQPT